MNDTLIPPLVSDIAKLAKAGKLVRNDKVLSYKEYPGKVVIVFEEGQKITFTSEMIEGLKARAKRAADKTKKDSKAKEAGNGK